MFRQQRNNGVFVDMVCDEAVLYFMLEVSFLYGLNFPEELSD